MTLLLAIGCSPAGGDEATGGGSDGTGSDTAGTSATSSSAGSGSTGGSSGGSGSTGDPICEDDGDFSGPQLRDCDLPGACGTCMWEKACASFLFRCAHNADCVCAAECVAVSGVSGIDSCLAQCGLNELPPGFADWVKGASDMCWDEGCGTLDEPPVDPNPPSGGDPGAGTDPDCAFDADLPYDPCGDVLQLQSSDGSFCARIERRNDGPGNDANTAFTLLDARIGPLGQVCHTDDPDNLCWYASHHNFSEWVHMTCGDLHYDLNIGLGCGKFSTPDSTFLVKVFQEGPASGEACASTGDGACPVVAPMELFPVE